MVRIKALWGAFQNLVTILSFVVNLVLILVIIFLLMLIFDIKNGIAQPLIGGLHSSFVGLDDARILTTINVKDSINVKDTIPVKLNIPLQQNTVVVLTDSVPLRVNAAFTLRDGTTLNGIVNIQLPKGLQLPVALNLNVPVDSTLPIDIKVPVNLNVPVNIPLNQTELHGPFDKLKTLFDPFDRLMNNLPSSWRDVWPLVGCILAGRPPDLLSSPDQIAHTCPAYSASTTSNAPIPPSVTPTGQFGTGGAQPATAQPGGDLNPTAIPGQPTEPGQVAPTTEPGQPIPTTEGGQPAPTTVPGQPATQAPPQETATPVKDLGIITPTR